MLLEMDHFHLPAQKYALKHFKSDALQNDDKNSDFGKQCEVDSSWKLIQIANKHRERC